MSVGFIWCIYYLKSILGEIWSVCIFKPFVFSLTILNRIRPSHEDVGIFRNASYIFSKKHWYQKALFSTFQFLAHVGSWLTGIKEIKDGLGEFVIGKKEDLYIGLQRTESNETFGIAGLCDENGIQPVELMWRTSLKSTGRFAVLSSELTPSNVYRMNCVWVTGKFSGVGFTLGKIESLDDLRKFANEDHIPSHYFSQPIFHQLVFETLTFLGISSLIGLFDAFSKLKIIYSQILIFFKI